MEIKPGYKQTEIGVIPEDWVVIQLGKVIHKMQLGGNYANSEAATGPPLIKMGNIGRGMIVLDRLEYIRDTDKQRDEDILCAGDVIFNTRNTLDLVGKVAIWRNELPLAYFNSNIMKITFDGKYIASNEYANYVLNSRHTISRLRDIATGTTSVAAIYTRDLLKIDLLISPTNEQIKIARCLTDIDSLITSLEKLIEKKKFIKQGVMQELLTGKRRLPGFRREWETKRLGDVSVVIMGQSPDSKYYNADSKGIPLIQGNADIQNGKSVSRIWTKSITKECQKGAILITVRAPVGSVGISSSRACLGRGVCAVQPYSVNERYLYWQLKFSEDKWNESQQGSTFTSVNSNQIKDFCILCPTSFDEQAAIADVIEDIEIEIDLHIKQLNKQILLKQAMMQELLTGRIRLI